MLSKMIGTTTPSCWHSTIYQQFQLDVVQSRPSNPTSHSAARRIASWPIRPSTHRKTRWSVSRWLRQCFLFNSICCILEQIQTENHHQTFWNIDLTTQDKFDVHFLLMWNSKKSNMSNFCFTHHCNIAFKLWTRKPSAASQMNWLHVNVPEIPSKLIFLPLSDAITRVQGISHFSAFLIMNMTRLSFAPIASHFSSKRFSSSLEVLTENLSSRSTKQNFWLVWSGDILLATCSFILCACRTFGIFSQPIFPRGHFCPMK